MQAEKTITTLDPPSGMDLRQHVHHILEWQLIQIQIIATVQFVAHLN